MAESYTVVGTCGVEISAVRLPSETSALYVSLGHARLVDPSRLAWCA